MQGQQEHIDAEEQEFVFRSVLNKWADMFMFLLRSWKILVLAACIGGLIGLIYAWRKPVTYTARLSFVVEESKQGGGGSIVSALAGQFGFDVGNMTGSSGMLA